jgi:hypothetical protein
MTDKRRLKRLWKVVTRSLGKRGSTSDEKSFLEKDN